MKRKLQIQQNLIKLNFANYTVFIFITNVFAMLYNSFYLLFISINLTTRNKQNTKIIKFAQYSF